MKAEKVGTRTHGSQVVDRVRCSCGEVTEFYAWSWAGHGKARCPGCRSWISYKTLEVTKPPSG